MKLAFVAICLMLIGAAAAQSMAEIMLMTNMFGGGSRGGSGAGNPFASLFGGSTSGATTGMGSLASSSSATSTNPLSALFGGGGGGAAGGSGMSRMGRMGGAMMLGGAEMSNLMDFYLCGTMRVSLGGCAMMMHQNM